MITTAMKVDGRIGIAQLCRLMHTRVYAVAPLAIDIFESGEPQDDGRATRLADVSAGRFRFDSETPLQS